MPVPGIPSLARKLLLAPAAALYLALAALHRTLWLRPARSARSARFAPSAPPLIVIGSLRAGGAGKTPVARELARSLIASGYRVGVLAYALEVRVPGACAEVFPDSDWRASSDEAVLLARGLPGARVFATRDRVRAREALARTGAFDVLVSDDGLMDTRLRDAWRVAVVRPGENPGWMDLLPAGPYRLRGDALAKMDFVLREGEGFHRESLAPEEWPAERPGWIVGGLGSPDRFLHALQRAGIRIAGSSFGPDHGLPDLARARHDARRAGVENFLCSEKDAVKLENHPERPANLLRVGERVTLSPEFLRGAEAYLAAPTS